MIFGCLRDLNRKIKNYDIEEREPMIVCTAKV